jgi:predicted outer membrane repeat protein
MELIRSTVSGNSVTAPENVAADGGGIFNSERNFPVSNLLKLTESTISGNSSTFNGGGISNLAGTIIFDGASRVTGNTAGESGGGIYNTGGGNVTLDSSANVSGNTPNNCAGDMIPLCSS